jgi:hypothetical protein
VIIPWFPWLERLSIAAGVSGFAILGGMRLGPVGLLLGALVGWCVGHWAVNLPLVFWVSWQVDRLHSLSTEQLQSLFVSNPGFGRTFWYQTAMSVMKQRDADVRPVLPILLDLMGSPKLKIRLHAWSAFWVGFPELRDRLQDYSPHEPAEVCQASVSNARSALTGVGEGTNQFDQRGP